MSGTVWGRRFSDRESVRLFEAFNASIEADRFLAAAEVSASQAYARGLHQARVLSDGELQDILRGLEAVGSRIEGGEDLSRFEDIHSAVELLLVDEIGDAGKKLHTGRSRNEQVATDERIYVRTGLGEALSLIEGIQQALILAAEAHPSVVMPGYTHLQRGQPVLYSHYLMSFFWPLERGKSRLREARRRADVLPLGSGALAGTAIPLDRELLRELLEFSGVSENSIDAVSDRSFVLDALFALLLVLLDLARLAADIVIFVSSEFGFLELEDSLATSSSLMPQKKNPDVFELVRAAPARLFGHVGQLLLLIKGLPSSYNKDLQEDKRPIREGMEHSLDVLRVVASALPRVKPVPQRMRRAIDTSLYATDIVDFLVAKGVPFREAHGLVGELVRTALAQGRSLGEMRPEDFRAFHPSFGADIGSLFDPDVSIRGKRTPGSTHPERVRDEIEKAKALLRPTGTSP